MRDPECTVSRKITLTQVVVMDINLPGIEATRRIMLEGPSTIVIGLSFGVNPYVTQAMKAAGAATCVTKERAVEELYRTIKDVVKARAVPVLRPEPS